MKILEIKEIRDLIYAATFNYYSVNVRFHSVFIYLNDSHSNFLVLIPSDSDGLFISFYDLKNQERDGRRISTDGCYSIFEHPFGTEVVLL